MPSLRTHLALALAATSLLGVVPNAHAAFVDRAETPFEVLYHDIGDVDDNVAFSAFNGQPWHFGLLPNQSGAVIGHGIGCAGELNHISCPSFNERVVFDLRGGNDSVEASTSGGVETSFLGGDGNDSFRSGIGPYGTFEGGNGNDSFMVQTYSGQSSPVALNGGPGDDRLGSPQGSNTTLTGGPGNDTAVGSSTGSDLSLDGQANDGIQNQAVSMIASDVENVDGGTGNDNISGDGGANELNGKGGNDHIEGGEGADKLIGDAGNDTIDARDGGADTVSCGFGSDTVDADAADTVALDCETVRRVPAGQGGSGNQQGGSGNQQGGSGNQQGGSGNQQGGSGDQQQPGDQTTPALKPLNSSIAAKWAATKKFTKVKKLVVSGVSTGGQVTVSCTGRGCPRGAKTVPVSTSRAVLTKVFKKKKLKPGAVIEVRTTASGYIGKVVRYTIRKKRTPKVQTLCLPAGASGSPTAC